MRRLLLMHMENPLEIRYIPLFTYKKLHAWSTTRRMERKRMHWSCQLLASIHYYQGLLVDGITYSGLGAGISASAFHQHNISTTIVEIDPAVYTAARQYFGLPDPGEGNIFLEDARGWVARRVRSASSKPFDIVIHDCFSGGGVPKHIFTVEFWDDLKGILSPEGVVGVVSISSIQWIYVTQGHLVYCRILLDISARLHHVQSYSHFNEYLDNAGPFTMGLRSIPRSNTRILSSI